MTDVFVRVMETKYPPPGRSPQRYERSKGALFRTWLFLIALRLLLDFRRSQGRAVDFSDLQAEVVEGEVAAFEATLPGRDLPPVEQVITVEQRAHVQDCMKRLPDRERVAIALWLETGGEMTLADLADALGVSVPTACRVLQNAFRLMRECLERKE